MLITTIFSLYLEARVALAPRINKIQQDSKYVDLASYGKIPLKSEKKVFKDKKMDNKDKKTDKIAQQTSAINRQVKAEVPVSISSIQEIRDFFEKYGNEYGLDPKLLEKIAYCESGFNNRAVNGPYAGLFQFCSSTWVSNRRALGLNTNPNLRFNAEESVRTAAFKISRDGTGAWPVCGNI